MRERLPLFFGFALGVWGAARCSAKHAAAPAAGALTVLSVSPATVDASQTVIVTWMTTTGGNSVVAILPDTVIARSAVVANQSITTAVAASLLAPGENSGSVSVFTDRGESLRADFQITVSSPATTGGSSGGTSTGSSGGTTGSTTGSAAGAAPTFIGSATFNGSSSNPNATFAAPAGISAGDFILVEFASDDALDNLDISTLAMNNWTLLDAHIDYGGDRQSSYLIYRFAGASEPASYSFNDLTSGDDFQGLLRVYRGVNQSAPINAFEVFVDNVGDGGNPSANASTPTPAITTTVDNCLAIAGLAPDMVQDAPNVSVWPAGFDADQLSLVAPTIPAWSNACLYSADQVLPTAGTLPASAFDWHLNNGVLYSGSLTFVLALAPT